ncbi:MAG TPA: NAD-dependent epimerase/dehydratase family protein [Segeticoccus sp.]|uniref:NAD-dependent epimerase/dehydratase family protein n=1 Tax=Segeticoccus sp. TaxID=2706531 RepID=UPI002D8024B8|nr:NAD-dependent epimerase/dehydratase family protein [Segeticoccus sp.]HET8600743.1 NAD-dependent epimerase/dehydratase family protein [Segeticoccus sp.]
MKALITGSTGFIGGHLTAQLGELGWDVQPLALRGHEVDVRDAEAVHECMRNVRPDVVFHLAGISGPMVAPSDPGLVAAVNCGGTVNVFEAARESGASRVVYASSVSGFDGGSPNCPEPLTVYGASKRFGEAALRAQMGVDILHTSARIGSVYGRGRQTLDTLDNMILQARRDGLVSYAPHGKVPLIHIADLAAALAALGSVQVPPETCDLVVEFVGQEVLATLVAKATGAVAKPSDSNERDLATYPGGFTSEDVARLVPDRHLTTVAEALPDMLVAS